MTLKYESEILYGLMKRDGDDSPSDVLPYESELKEKYLNQVVGAYPKLQDYRPEWLNYNLYKHLPADFPVESVSNVTDASFQNVVPYAYKSAILKGQTKLLDELGNECESHNIPIGTTGFYIDESSGRQIVSDTSFGTTFLKCPKVTFILKGNNRYKRIIFYDKNKSFIKGFNSKLSNNSNVTFDSNNIPTDAIYVRFSASLSSDGVDYTPDTNLLIEDINGNNLYITHLESVKMPVLTTTGKNLFDVDLLEIGNINGATGDNAATNKMARTDFIKVNSSSNKITCSVTGDYVVEKIAMYDINKKFIGRKEPNLSSFTITLNSRTEYIKVVFKNNVNPDLFSIDTLKLLEIQIEHGDGTTYEPYKSNILTVNEDVTLRSNGSVYDELDLLTGKLTQRIDENGEVLSQEIVKTVDLTCSDEQGQTVDFMPLEGTMNVQTSSDTIQPLLDMEVPIEAITQNLNSFATMEE